MNAPMQSPQRRPKLPIEKSNLTDREFVLSHFPDAKLSRHMNRGDEISYKVTCRNGSFKSYGNTSRLAWQYMAESVVEHISSELKFNMP